MRVSDDFYMSALLPGNKFGMLVVSQKRSFSDLKIDKKTVPKRNLKQRSFLHHLLYASWCDLDLGSLLGLNIGRKTAHKVVQSALGCLLASTWRTQSRSTASLRRLGLAFGPCLASILGRWVRYWALQDLAPRLAHTERHTLDREP